MGRTSEYCTLIILSYALLVRIPYATFIIVTIEKTIVIIFNKFSPFVISFLYFDNLISLVTPAFSSQIPNTVLQLSPVISSVFKI